MSNSLINEQSPYLLDHAENPVDWYPWCDEAFEKPGARISPFSSPSDIRPATGAM